MCDSVHSGGWGEGVLSQHALQVLSQHALQQVSRGGSAPGGSAPRGSAPRGVCLKGVPGGDPPGRLLLRTVRILLECILVLVFFPNEKIFVQLDELDESERITQAYK